MMRDDKRPWGFWFRIFDAESAGYAAKMSGLPVFLAGAWSVLWALFSMARHPAWLIAAIAVIGGVFVVAGLRIRAGRLAFVPALVPLYLILVGVNIVLIPAVNAILPVLTAVLSINGLRGWWWLRNNGGK